MDLISYPYSTLQAIPDQFDFLLVSTHLLRILRAYFYMNYMIPTILGASTTNFNPLLPHCIYKYKYKYVYLCVYIYIYITYTLVTYIYVSTAIKIGFYTLVANHLFYVKHHNTQIIFNYQSIDIIIFMRPQQHLMCATDISIFDMLCARHTCSIHSVKHVLHGQNVKLLGQGRWLESSS